jgi:hypothetical protein
MGLYHEAKALASEIAKRDHLHEDGIFSDALHVAVALALGDEGMPYTMANVVWMFDRVRPEEVRDILLLRQNHRRLNLPMAGRMESLIRRDQAAAAARNLPRTAGYILLLRPHTPSNK